MLTCIILELLKKTYFIKMKVTEDACSNQLVFDEHDAPNRIVLPFKVQELANEVRHQLGDFSPTRLHRSRRTEDQRTV